MSDIKKHEDYLKKQEVARSFGMTRIVSVCLTVPEDMRHVLAPGEDPDMWTMVFVQDRPHWPAVIESIEKEQSPMIVRYLTPIGKIPLLLPPPTS